MDRPGGGIVNACPGCFTPLPRERAFGFKHSCLHTINTVGHRPSPGLCTTVIKLNVSDKQYAYKFQACNTGVICTTNHQQHSETCLVQEQRNADSWKSLPQPPTTSNVRVIGGYFHRPHGCKWCQNSPVGIATR